MQNETLSTSADGGNPLPDEGVTETEKPVEDFVVMVPVKPFDQNLHRLLTKLGWEPAIYRDCDSDPIDRYHSPIIGGWYLDVLVEQGGSIHFDFKDRSLD